MMVVLNRLKKIIVEEKKGIDFSNCIFDINSGELVFNGDFTNSIFTKDIFFGNISYKFFGIYDYCNFSDFDFSTTIWEEPASFKGANFNGATGLQAEVNTKLKFINFVGAENVNAETIWIDGTSILS